jgi:tetratricopeptide (TPR) repeat protein
VVILASEIELYRVFIASPGGLGDERRAFKETIGEYNESEAIGRGAMFVPVGWELTLPGIGRPQALINQDVEKCDYFVLLLWDRWGSPTGAEKTPRYSSGVEEEFHVALASFDDHSKPMRQLVAFFKSVEDRQLSDPGSQLQKVLDFKKKLETEKTLLFDTFDNSENLKQKLRRNLAAWLRDHESGTLEKVTKPQPPPPPPPLPSDEPTPQAFDTTVKADAEKELVQEVVRGNPNATIDYGMTLVASGRFSHAKAIFERALKLGLSPEAHSDVLSYLAGISSLDLDFVSAEQLYLESLKALDNIANVERHRTSRLAELGRLYLELARFDDAMRYLHAAKTLREAEHPENWAGVAYALSNIGSVYYHQTKFRDAEPPTKQALEIREAHLGRSNVVVAGTMIQLASIRRALGDYQCTEDLLNEALGMIKGAVYEWQRSGGLLSLGILRKNQSRYLEARELIEEALLRREKLRPEQPGVAVALNELADCMRLLGDLKDSERYFQRSLAIFEKSYGRDHPAVAQPLLGLARLYAEQSGASEAEFLLRRALDIWATRVGREVPFFARCELELARIHSRAGKVSEAEEAAKNVIYTFERQLGLSHPATVEARAFLQSLRSMQS